MLALLIVIVAAVALIFTGVAVAFISKVIRERRALNVEFGTIRIKLTPPSATIPTITFSDPPAPPPGPTEAELAAERVRAVYDERVQAALNEKLQNESELADAYSTKVSEAHDRYDEVCEAASEHRSDAVNAAQEAFDAAMEAADEAWAEATDTAREAREGALEAAHEANCEATDAIEEKYGEAVAAADEWLEGALASIAAGNLEVGR